MKEKLAEINSISGVRGSFIFFNDGELVFDAIPAGYDEDSLMEISRDIVQVGAICDRLAPSNHEVEMKFESGWVVAWVLSHYNIIILCDPGVSHSMLRLTVNVAVADLEADKKFQKRINKIEATRRSFLIRSNMDVESWSLVEVVN